MMTQIPGNHVSEWREKKSSKGPPFCNVVCRLQQPSRFLKYFDFFKGKHDLFSKLAQNDARQKLKKIPEQGMYFSK